MALRSTAQTWDSVRAAFASSIMIDTALTSLAQNLDGPEWPVVGADETPASYVDLRFEEAVALLGRKGQPPERMDDLITILQDTLAFDDPFGEMVQQGDAAAGRDNPILKNLARLEIPPTYPIELCALSAETRAFCELEKLPTLAEFAVFAQNLSRHVIVGGDFRALLNALSHVDERVIAQFLPFRPGSRGLHLIEAVVQVARTLTPPERVAVAGGAAPRPELVARVERLVDYFNDDAAQLKSQATSGGDWVRRVHVPDDEGVERAAVALLTRFVAPPVAAAARGSWFARLFKRS